MTGGQDVAVVTGASQGIGRSIEMCLGNAGWHVVAVSRNEDGLNETAGMIIDAGGSAEGYAADVTREDAIVDLALSLSERGLQPGALVNSSGIAGPSRPLWEVSLAEWDATFVVNVTGAFLIPNAPIR